MFLLCDLYCKQSEILMCLKMPDTLDKFKELLKFASQLDPLPEEYHTHENRVHGCVAQVRHDVTAVCFAE